MAIRSSWAVNDNIDVEEARMAIALLLTPGMRDTATYLDQPHTRSGFKPGFNTDPGRVTAVSTTSLSVAPLQYVMPAQRSANGGAYLITSDTALTLLPMGTDGQIPDGTYSRIDRVILQQNDQFYGDGDSDAHIRIVVGTPSATPAVPTVTGSPAWVELARYTLPANANDMTKVTITDMRSTDRWTVAAGGSLPVPTTTARNLLNGKAWPGMTVYNQQTQRLETFVSGTTWTQAAPQVTLGTIQMSVNYYESAGNSTWTVPSGLEWLRVMMVGGGGGGGGANAGSAGVGQAGGGGGGCYAEGWFSGKLFTAGANVSLKVGAGGAGGVNNGTGGVGGITSFGSSGEWWYTVCQGGGGGGGATASNTPASATFGVGGDITSYAANFIAIPGEDGQHGRTIYSGTTTAVTYIFMGDGGASHVGAGGRAGDTYGGLAHDGGYFGGGGGGGISNNTYWQDGGDGAVGMIRLIACIRQ